MGIFDTVRNQARKVQLQGEIVLVDREITARKNKFGIDLYTLLTIVDKDKKNGINGTGGIIKMPSFFCSNEQTLRVPFDECRADIVSYQNSIDSKELEIHHLSSARERSKPAITNKEYIDKAASRVADAASETKLQYDITMLERQIKQRKEKFGNDVYDICISSIVVTDDNTFTTTTSPNRGKKGTINPFSAMKAGVSKAVSTFNSTEIDIKNCILLAKRDVDSLLKQRSIKEREIDSLTTNTTTTTTK